MRALFTCVPVPGHFYPLVPFARALAAGGHEVAFAVPEYFAPAAAAAGFDHVTAGFARPWEEALPQVRTMAGPERLAFFQREIFGGLLPRYLIPDILTLAARWPPDLVVWDGNAFGGGVAAERLGLPHASVSVLAASELGRRESLAAGLDPQRVALGLAPDPEIEMPHRYLNLYPFPPSFRDPAYPLRPTTHPIRPTPADRSGPEGLPAWAATLPDGPTIYVGLGTVYNKPEVFNALLAGLREEALTLIVTVGRDQDPAEYGPQPANVHIERYIPLSLLLTYCDLAVIHGGSGTLMAALGHGLPVVVVPIAADQPANADRCRALGLGQVVDLRALTPERARQAVREVLADASFRENAGRLRDEMAGLPGPDEAVPLFERLAVEKRPLYRDGRSTPMS